LTLSCWCIPSWLEKRTVLGGRSQTRRDNRDRLSDANTGTDPDEVIIQTSNRRLPTVIDDGAWVSAVLFYLQLSLSAMILVYFDEREAQPLLALPTLLPPPPPPPPPLYSATSTVTTTTSYYSRCRDIRPLPMRNMRSESRPRQAPYTGGTKPNTSTKMRPRPRWPRQHGLIRSGNMCFAK